MINKTVYVSLPKGLDHDSRTDKKIDALYKAGMEAILLLLPYPESKEGKKQT